jgi:hypothetical protein
MKTIIQTLACVAFTSILFAQTNKKATESFVVNSIYQDYKSELVTSDVLTFDATLTNPKTGETVVRVDPLTGDEINYNKARLMNHFDNWLKEFSEGKQVKVKKDTSHYAILYRTKFDKDEVNVLLLVEFKNNKVRMRFYDEGDVRTKVRPVPVNFSLMNRFSKDVIVYNPTDLTNKETIAVMNLKKYKSDIDQIIASLNFYIIANDDFVLSTEEQLLNIEPSFDF